MGKCTIEVIGWMGKVVRLGSLHREYSKMSEGRIVEGNDEEKKKSRR